MRDCQKSRKVQNVFAQILKEIDESYAEKKKAATEIERTLDHPAY